MKDENLNNILEYLKHLAESNKLKISILVSKDVKELIIVKEEENE